MTITDFARKKKKSIDDYDHLHNATNSSYPFCCYRCSFIYLPNILFSFPITTTSTKQQRKKSKRK